MPAMEQVGGTAIRLHPRKAFHPGDGVGQVVPCDPARRKCEYRKHTRLWLQDLIRRLPPKLDVQVG